MILILHNLFIQNDLNLDLLVLADLHQANNLRTLALKVIVDSGKEIVSQVSQIYLLSS